MNFPKFSIVIATYNAEKTLDACLDSLKNQTYRNFEVLVADGVSKDRTLEILNRRRNEMTVLISEKDRGIYDAWNKVLPKMTGDWALFLGADDALWDSSTLEKAASLLSGTTANVAYGKVATILPNGETFAYEGSPWEKDAKKFRHEMTIPHQGTFHGKKLFEEHGYFNPSFRICGDYEFLLRELKDHSAIFFPELIVSRMAFGGVSSTYKNVPVIIRELSVARRLNGFRFPSFFITMRWIRYGIRTAVRAILGRRFADFMADTYRRLVGKPALWSRFK